MRTQAPWREPGGVKILLKEKIGSAYCISETLLYLCAAKLMRGVAQLVSAPRSGRGGRKFESSHPD